MTDRDEVKIIVGFAASGIILMAGAIAYLYGPAWAALLLGAGLFVAALYMI